MRKKKPVLGEAQGGAEENLNASRNFHALFFVLQLIGNIEIRPGGFGWEGFLFL